DRLSPGVRSRAALRRAWRDRRPQSPSGGGRCGDRCRLLDAPKQRRACRGALRVLFFWSARHPPSARITIDAVERLHVFGLFVASLALLGVVFAVRIRGRRERAAGGRNQAGTRADSSQEIAASHFGFLVLFHRLSPLIPS